MKYLIAVFTILFISSIFILSAHAIETGVSDEVSATNTKDTTKSMGDTGVDRKSSVSEMAERSQSAKLRDSRVELRKKRQARLMDSKESTNGNQTSTSNDLISEKNIKPNPVKRPPNPRPAPIGDKPQR